MQCCKCFFFGKLLFSNHNIRLFEVTMRLTLPMGKFINYFINLLGIAISTISLKFSNPSNVAIPISTLFVAATSKRQFSSSPHTSLALSSIAVLLNEGSNTGLKEGS